MLHHQLCGLGGRGATQGNRQVQEEEPTWGAGGARKGKEGAASAQQAGALGRSCLREDPSVPRKSP